MATRLVAFTLGDTPQRLDKALSSDVPEGEARSRTRLVADGAVRVNDAMVTDPKTKVVSGAQIQIAVEVVEDSDIGSEDINLDIVFEDADLIVVKKPAGIVVHPAPGAPSGTLVNALLHHCGDDLSGVGG